MPSIEFNDVSYAHPGGEMLFEGVSFKVAAGSTVALVGENGVGKSTLLRVASGELEAIQGNVVISGRYAVMPQLIGMMGGDLLVRDLLLELASPDIRTAARRLYAAEDAQAAHPTIETGIEVAEAFAAWDEVNGYQQEAFWDACTQRILRQDYAKASARPVAQLSGGEQKKLALEALFSSNAEVLLLDEPDNYLDIPAKRWLEQLIRESSKTILMVSHDRELLSQAADRIVTVEAHGAWVHGAGFSTYHEERERRNERLGDAVQRWNEEERRLYRHYRWMKQRAAVNDKNAAAANAAEHRWKRFVDEGPPPLPPKQQQVKMRLKGGDSGRRVVECKRLELTGLIDAFDLSVSFGERVAVLGPNGAGKSHFLRLLAGEEILHEGQAVLGARVQPGYFSQTHTGLDSELTPLEILREMSEQSAMAALARYRLHVAAKRPVSTMSGGQQARLQILLLELGGANFLLLDEPTDNLDVDSAESLQEALDQFEGTVMVVTHDRWFMRGLDRFLVFDYAGNVREAPDVDAALEIIAQESTRGMQEAAARVKAIDLTVEAPSVSPGLGR